MHKWNPGDYEKSATAQYSWAIGLMSCLNHKGDERILDIGSGNGKITARLAEMVPRGTVVGIDISPDMVDYARNKYPPKKYPNLSFQIGDASHLDFCEEFDIVVSFACLHWVKDHLPVLGGVFRSLMPGGRVLFQCGGKGNAADILTVTEELIRMVTWSEFFHDASSPYHFYGPEEYRKWLTQAGLKPLRVELIPKEMVHEGRVRLEGFLSTTWLPYTERLPEGLRQDFISEIARRYIDLYPLDEGGKVHVKMMRLEVEAERPL